MSFVHWPTCRAVQEATPADAQFPIVAAFLAQERAREGSRNV